MKSLSKVALLGSVLLTSSSAFAIDMPDMSGYYYHAQYAMLDVEVSNNNGSGSAANSAVVLEIGRSLYDHEIANIFLEGVVMLGLDEDTAFTSGADRTRAGVDGGFGIQAKAERQFNNEFAGFINLGLMNTTVTVANDSGFGGRWILNSPIADGTETSIIYAFGGAYQLTGTSALTISYNNLFSGSAGSSDVDVTSINLGYKAKF